MIWTLLYITQWTDRNTSGIWMGALSFKANLGFLSCLIIPNHLSQSLRVNALQGKEEKGKGLLWLPIRAIPPVDGSECWYPSPTWKVKTLGLMVVIICSLSFFVMLLESKFLYYPTSMTHFHCEKFLSWVSFGEGDKSSYCPQKINKK